MHIYIYIYVQIYITAYLYTCMYIHTRISTNIYYCQEESAVVINLPRYACTLSF